MVGHEANVSFRVAENLVPASRTFPIAASVGRDVTVEQAYENGKLVGLGLLSAAKAAAGSLDEVEIVKMPGMVNAVPEFTQAPQVINGCSDLFVAVLGDNGRHARSAVGMDSLPEDITVKIEVMIRVLAE
jgi:enamine deaminase RidA (YjgF/YER057c/UK114 family)